MHVAADAGSAEAVRLLLRQGGADVNAPREEDRRSPLHIAVNDSHADVVETLLASGANVNAADVDGWQSLHVAAYYSEPGIVDLLLRHKAQVE